MKFRTICPATTFAGKASLFTPQKVQTSDTAHWKQHSNQMFAKPKEDKGFFNGRPHHKLPTLVTRLAQMTASCFYPSHLLHNTCHKHTASCFLRRFTEQQLCLLADSRKTNSWRIRKAHSEKCAEESEVMSCVFL